MTPVRVVPSCPNGSPISNIFATTGSKRAERFPERSVFNLNLAAHRIRVLAPCRASPIDQP